MEEKQKRKDNLVMILAIVVIILFVFLGLLSLGITYEHNRTEYYKELLLTNCEITHVQSDIIDSLRDGLSFYTDAYESISFPELKECDYWLLDRDK